MIAHQAILSKICNGYHELCQPYGPDFGQPTVSMGYLQEWVRKIQIGIGTRHSQDCPLSPGKSEDLV
jgi:hypothetical protein